MSERGQAGDRARAQDGAEGGGSLPRRDPGGAGRSRGRIPTRFSRENPPFAASDQPRPKRRPAALPRRSGAGAAPERTEPAAAPYAIRPGAPVVPAQPDAADSAEPAPAAAFSVRPGGPAAPTGQGEENDGAIAGVLVEDRPPAANRPRPRPRGAQPAAPQPPARGTAGKASPQRRRRLTRTIVVTTVLLGGGAALAVVAAGGGAKHAAQGTASSPSAAAPSLGAAPPPAGGTPSPVGPSADSGSFLDNAATDTAPLSAATLFPAQTLTVNGRSYTRALTDETANCASVTTAPLNAVLAKNGCRAVYRATYTAGSTAATVGIAVFDTNVMAGTARQQATSGNLESLFGGTTPKFCRAVACRLSTNAVGRYVYFTVSGYTNGKAVPANDTAALAAGTDTATAAFQSLVHRAQSEARQP